jgi:hypothetical protein
VTPYNYTLNNPINRIDPTGLLCKEVKTGPGKTPKGAPQNPCEGDIYITRNGREFTFYNGQWYSSYIVLNQVIVTPNDSELARINPSLRGNNNSGYIYNKYDLKIREKLLAIRGRNSIVTFMLRMEEDGDYQPLHSLNFYKNYTKKFHSNSSFYFAAENVPEISEIFLFANPIGAEISVWRSGARGVTTAAKGTVQYSDDLVRAAQETYPKLKGKTQLHHITPKYLGGAKNGPTVPLDAAYHQIITNEFRALWGYGKGVPSATELQNIMKQVYSKYPLPPNSGF